MVLALAPKVSSRGSANSWKITVSAREVTASSVRQPPMIRSDSAVLPLPS